MWLDQICQMVKLGVNAREIQYKMDEVDDEIREQQVEIDKKKVILSYMNCDPQAQKENEKMLKLWDGA